MVLAAGLAGKASQTWMERALDSTVTTCYLLSPIPVGTTQDALLFWPPSYLCPHSPCDMELVDCHPLSIVRDKAMSGISRLSLPFNHSA